jgi:hypothetical protein
VGEEYSFQFLDSENYETEREDIAVFYKNDIQSSILVVLPPHFRWNTQSTVDKQRDTEHKENIAKSDGRRLPTTRTAVTAHEKTHKDF